MKQSLILYSKNNKITVVAIFKSSVHILFFFNGYIHTKMLNYKLHHSVSKS